jgi:hypothetical protein
MDLDWSLTMIDECGWYLSNLIVSCSIFHVYGWGGSAFFFWVTTKVFDFFSWNLKKKIDQFW